MLKHLLKSQEPLGRDSLIQSEGVGSSVGVPRKGVVLSMEDAVGDVDILHVLFSFLSIEDDTAVDVFALHPDQTRIF